jgi:protein-S-isoprenylcysteine O-methyltransferase Ste14
MKEHIAHSGAWGLALIVILLVSWFFYRWFAPKNWREWAGAGLVQAFIIALFGEGIVHWPTVFSVALFPLIVLAYYLLAKSEERKVEEEFGEQYREYKKRVPMVFPRRGQWRALATGGSEPSD